MIKKHMLSPQNMGIIPAADGVGEVVGPACGDQVVIYIKIHKGRISQATFTTHGCWAAVAMGSLITELVLALTPEEALHLDGEALARKEARLPDDKWPCAGIVTQALHRAVRDWQRREKIK